jgi:hypothetical protein
MYVWSLEHHVARGLGVVLRFDRFQMPVCVCIHVCMNERSYSTWSTAILIIIEGHETAFNGFEYQFTTGKPLKNLKLTLNYYENDNRTTLAFGHLQKPVRV